MRPTKFTPDLLEAFRTVLADEWAALAFTEEELVWQANRHLPQSDRISYRTYQRYKAEIILNEECHTERSRSTQDFDDEADYEIDTTNSNLVLAMHDTLKEALFAQKKALVRGVGEGQTNWRRFAWLLERKFPDFRLKPLSEALAKPLLPKDTPEEKNEREKAAMAAEAEKKKQYYIAKAKAEKDAELERLKDPVYKWSRGYQPWTPFTNGGGFTMHLDTLKAREAELASDVAAGYQDPYAHLGYRPDPIERTDGEYFIMGMGPDRLPLRVHLYRMADAPNSEERERLWLKQEHQRLNIIRAEQGLPPENLPEPPEHAPSEPPARGRGINYGHSGMG